MLIVKNIRSSKGRIENALVVDPEVVDWVLPTSAPISQKDLLEAEEMLSLEDVIRRVAASSRSTVHAMEARNRLFGVLPPGRLRGKRYPGWQFDKRIIGEPLRQVLTVLESLDSWSKYQFFESTMPELGNLTPVEVLLGQPNKPDTLVEESRVLLSATPAERLKLVIEVAKEFAHST